MKIQSQIFIRLWTIMVGIMLGYSIYELIIRNILEKTCVLNTHTCMQIRYQSYANSVLIHAIPYGYWIFYDGQKAFIYGLETGASCKPPWTAAYVVDLKFNQILGYLCVAPIEKVQTFYNNIKAPTQAIFIRNPSWDFNAWSLLNYLSELNIININASK